MASKSLQTRLEQKARFEKQSEVRKGVLKEKGLNEKDITKDHEIKHFKARIKQIDGAIARISFLEDQTKKLMERKEQRKIEAEQARAEAAATTGRSKAKAKAAAQAKAEAPKKKGATGGKAPAKGKQEPKKKSK